MARVRFTIAALEGRREIVLEIAREGTLAVHVRLDAGSVGDLIRLLAQARADMLDFAPSDLGARVDVEAGPETRHDRGLSSEEQSAVDEEAAIDEELYFWLARRDSVVAATVRTAGKNRKLKQPLDREISAALRGLERQRTAEAAIDRNHVAHPPINDTS